MYPIDLLRLRARTSDNVTAPNKGRSIMKRYRLLAAAAIMALAIPAAFAAKHATPEQMQQRFMQMQTMMDQAQQAKTPAERQKAMADHMKTMQEQMAAMGDMMGQDGKMGQVQGGAAMDPNVASQMQMMGRHMSMMQQMMGQMMGQIMQQQLMMKPAP